VIKTLADRPAEELFATGRTKRVPPDIVRRARRKLESIDWASRKGGVVVSTPNTRKEVRPIHPGEMLREDSLPDRGLTVAGLGTVLGVAGRVA
jgi:hypothetical protein